MNNNQIHHENRRRRDEFPEWQANLAEEMHPTELLLLLELLAYCQPMVVSTCGTFRHWERNLTVHGTSRIVDEIARLKLGHVVTWMLYYHFVHFCMALTKPLPFSSRPSTPQNAFGWQTKLPLFYAPMLLLKHASKVSANRIPCSFADLLIAWSLRFASKMVRLLVNLLYIQSPVIPYVSPKVTTTFLPSNAVLDAAILLIMLAQQSAFRKLFFCIVAPAHISGPSLYVRWPWSYKIRSTESSVETFFHFISQRMKHI